MVTANAIFWCLLVVILVRKSAQENATVNGEDRNEQETEPTHGLLEGRSNDSTVLDTAVSVQPELIGNDVSNDPISVSAHDEYLFGVSKQMIIYIDPVIKGVGIVANSLMLVVMQRRSLKRSPVPVYMSALAVADNGVLVLDFLNNWLKTALGVQLKHSYDAFCKAHTFLFTAVYTYTAWLVVIVAAERFIVVWYPLKAKQLCTVRNAVVTVLVLPVLCCCMHVINLWMWKVNPLTQACDVMPAYHHYSSHVQPVLRGLFYSYLPLALLFVFSGGIISGLMRASAACDTMGATLKASRRVTVSVLAICIAYVIFSVPVTVFYVILFARVEYVFYGPTMAVVRSAIILWGSLNHAINLFLYVLTSANFRKELRAVCKCSGETPNLPAPISPPATLPG